MPKIEFTRVSIRDLLVAFGPMTLVVALVCIVAYKLVDPAPPRVIDFSTGPEDSAYQRLANQYVQDLAKNDITVRLQASQGSQENLQRISDPNSIIELGFVQSGSTDAEEAESKGLVSLGSLFYEPLWVFYKGKKELTSIAQFKGKRINVGTEGMGVARLFKQIMSANDVGESDVQLQRLDNDAASEALAAGKLDALVMVSAPDSPVLQELLRSPDVKLFNFNQAEAYTRRFPFLSHVVLPRGIVDFGKNIPANDVHLISPTATLVAHESLHPALIGLILQSAQKIHGRAGWFSRQAEFPSDRYTEIPVTRQAEKFYKNGPPFFQRYLSFWLANFLERMWVVLLALGALILPLSKIIPPLYVWRIRSRVYRWYGQLRLVEDAIEELGEQNRDLVCQQQLKALNELEGKVNHISVPLAYAEELYGLRSHIQFVRKRILYLQNPA